MSRAIETRSGDFTVEIESDGVAHLILGHAGRMPAMSAKGHAEIADIWRTLAQIIIKCDPGWFGIRKLVP